MSRKNMIQALVLGGLTVMTVAVSIVKGVKLAEEEKEYEIREAAIQTGMEELVRLEDEQEVKQQEIQQLQENQKKQESLAEELEKGKAENLQQIQQLESQQDALREEISSEQEDWNEIKMWQDEIKNVLQ